MLRIVAPSPAQPSPGRPDFVFSEMDSGLPYLPDDWTPEYLDYLALAFTARPRQPYRHDTQLGRSEGPDLHTGAHLAGNAGLIISSSVGILS